MEESIIGGIFMARSYRHISEYEEEILRLKSEGWTKREIGKKYGFTYEQVHISLYSSETYETANTITETGFWIVILDIVALIVWKILKQKKLRVSFQ